MKFCTNGSCASCFMVCSLFSCSFVLFWLHISLFVTFLIFLFWTSLVQYDISLSLSKSFFGGSCHKYFGLFFETYSYQFFGTFRFFMLLLHVGILTIFMPFPTEFVDFSRTGMLHCPPALSLLNALPQATTFSTWLSLTKMKIINGFAKYINLAGVSDTKTELLSHMFRSLSISILLPLW